MLRSKPFKTIDEQINILLDRNLIINDVEKAKLILLSQNYYNLINSYGCFFPQDSDDKFSKKTTFDEIVYLYSFEKEIKHSILQAIINAELHIKAIFAYRYAEAYHDKIYPYLDINCYDNDKIYDTIKTISKISSTIYNLSKPNMSNSISHYKNKYRDVPIWVIIHYLDFGTLLHLICNSTISIQNMVAKDLSQFINYHLDKSAKLTPETMLSFIANIHDVRNVCAHNNRLLDFQCKRDSKYFSPLHDKYNITRNSSRNSVFSVIISLQCFLSKTEYAILHNTLLKRMKTLDKKLVSADINSIINGLGFSSNWHKNEKKLEQ